jgi:hypothetical protein
LNVLVVDVVNDFLEAERLNFLCNVIQSSKGITSIGHDAVIIVEVDEVISVLHESCVVLGEELCGDVFQVVIHDTSILIFTTKLL